MPVRGDAAGLVLVEERDVARRREARRARAVDDERPARLEPMREAAARRGEEHLLDAPQRVVLVAERKAMPDGDAAARELAVESDASPEREETPQRARYPCGHRGEVAAVGRHGPQGLDQMTRVERAWRRGADDGGVPGRISQVQPQALRDRDVPDRRVHRSRPASCTVCMTGESRYSMTRRSPVLISAATRMPGRIGSRLPSTST
jgi:hypothetical protein